MKTANFAFSFSYVGRCDSGKVRTENQDRILMLPEDGLFAVSDGMGGLMYGAEASAYVTEALPLLIDSAKGGLKDSDESYEKVLSKAVGLASECLYLKANNSGRLNFGATVTCVWLHGESACICWMGDSRVYFLPNNVRSIVRLTSDMNVAGLLVEAGEISLNAAENHPGKSNLTAFVGMPSPADVRKTTVRLHPGDRLLICSDGLYSMVRDERILELAAEAQDVEAVAESLVSEANNNGGRDNISAIMLIIEEKTSDFGGGI